MLSCLMVTGGNRETAICEYMYNCDGRSLIEISNAAICASVQNYLCCVRVPICGRWIM